MPRFNVHAYAVVRFKLPGIEAESPSQACAKAEDHLYGEVHDLVDTDLTMPFAHMEFADEVAYFMCDPCRRKAEVDLDDERYEEMGDPEYVVDTEASVWLDGDGVHPFLMGYEGRKLLTKVMRLFTENLTVEELASLRKDVETALAPVDQVEA